MHSSADTRPPSIVDLAVFLAELAMLAALAVAGARLGGTAGTAIPLAIVLPVVAAALWGRWLAPRAGHRLENPARLGLKLALVVVAAALLAGSGLIVWGVVFLVVAAGLHTASELSARPG